MITHHQGGSTTTREDTYSHGMEWRVGGGRDVGVMQCNTRPEVVQGKIKKFSYITSFTILTSV